jgi:hypothetical protein
MHVAASDWCHAHVESALIGWLCIWILLCVIDRLSVHLNSMMCDSYDKWVYAAMYCISCAAYFWLYVIFRSWPSTSNFLGILFVPRGEAARLEAVCGSSSPGHLQLEFKDQLRGSSLRVSFTLIYLSTALYCEIELWYLFGINGAAMFV